MGNELEFLFLNLINVFLTKLVYFGAEQIVKQAISFQ